MAQDEPRGTWVTVVKVVVALIAGLFVLVLLFPYSAVDSRPPTCWSVFGYEVPCGTRLSYANLSLAAGAATATVVGLAFWLDGRRRKRRG